MSLTLSTSTPLQEIINHYTSNDTHLGLRRLLDATMETKDMQLFEDVLSFCTISEQQNSTETLLPLVYAHIEKLERALSNTVSTEKKASVILNEVQKNYNKGNFKLSPVSFSLYPKDIIGLVGENGNGKTTLLRVILGELEPDKGDITYNISRSYKTKYDLKSYLAFIPQRIPRWFGSLKDNLHFAAVHYGLKGKENELWTELMIARLGLRPYKNLTWDRLSSGYRTRFEIAKTLLQQPEILLLDEPLANLDINAQQTILQDLKYIAQSNTKPLSIILSSQQIYEVEKVSSKIVFLRNGVPVYQDMNTTTENGTQKTMIEIETPATREEISTLFHNAKLEKINYNGGVYILTFSEHISTKIIMQQLAQAPFDIIYIRNISNSSRRFFASV